MRRKVKVEPFMTTVQLSETLQITGRHIRTWVDSGLLRHYKTCGGRYRFRISDVNDFIDEQMRQALRYPPRKMTRRELTLLCNQVKRLDEEGRRDGWR